MNVEANTIIKGNIMIKGKIKERGDINLRNKRRHIWHGIGTEWT